MYNVFFFFRLWHIHQILVHGFLLRSFTITLIGHTTLGTTPLVECSAQRRDLYLTVHNTHNRHSCPQLDSNPQSQQASGHIPMP